MTLPAAGNSSTCVFNPTSLEEAEFQLAMRKIAVKKHGYCEGDALLKTLFERRSNGDYSVEWVNGARQGWLAHSGRTQPIATNEGSPSVYAAAWAAIDDLAHRPEIMDMSLPDAIRALVAEAGATSTPREGRDPIGYVQPEPNLEHPDRRIVVVPDGTPVGTPLYLK